MCGIAGWIARARRQLDARSLMKLTDMLAHRGPDGFGHVLLTTRDQKYSVALGHRRLSIIDLEGGHQPMSAMNGSLTIVFNGEIYNYVELREELTQLGHAFVTTSDTEVLLAAYSQWGTAALTRLRGMFAFALWDASTQSAMFARDPFGKKPLFLARVADELVFCSEVAPLANILRSEATLPGIDLSLTPGAIDHFLLNRYVPCPMTLFRGIEKLPPGCLAIWKCGELSIHRYFVPPLGTRAPEISDIREAAPLLSETLSEAVKIRMRSDAPFGAYLSGGLDSSVVVGLMSKFSSAPIRTYSMGFSEGSYSEVAHARKVADFFATDHHELIIDEHAFFDAWPNAVLRRGAPVSEASDIPILLLSELAGRSDKVVLTGEGADEFLGGYPKHRAEPWVALYQHVVSPMVHNMLASALSRMRSYHLRRIGILLDAAGERNQINRMRLWFGGASVVQRDCLIDRVGASMPPDLFPYSCNNPSALRRTLFFDQTSWLPDNLLERGDRMMMAGSVEGRMPFMDTALADVVARFDDDLLIGTAGGKRVLRRVAEGIIPKSIIERKKVGFRVPFHLWFRGDHASFVKELLTSDASRVSRMLSKSHLATLVADHIDGRHNNERILWALMNLEMFLRLFNISDDDALRAQAA